MTRIRFLDFVQYPGTELSEDLLTGYSVIFHCTHTDKGGPVALAEITQHFQLLGYSLMYVNGNQFVIFVANH